MPETEMYPDVHFLGGKIVNVGEVWVTTKDTQLPRRFTFFSSSLLHEVGGQPLVVDLKGGLQTLTNFPKGKSQAKSLQATLAPRVSQEPKSNKQTR
jgi:hypothetical protein